MNGWSFWVAQGDGFRTADVYASNFATALERIGGGKVEGYSRRLADRMRKVTRPGVVIELHDHTPNPRRGQVKRGSRADTRGAGLKAVRGRRTARTCQTRLQRVCALAKMSRIEPLNIGGIGEMKRLLCLFLFGLPVCVPSAIAAPQNLYGKTLRVTWEEARHQRVQGESDFRSVSVPLSYTVYVSTKGQLFKRLTSTTSNGRQSGSKDRVGTSGSDAQGSGNIAFQGNTLIATANNGGLGRRIRITSDGASCSAEVLTGKAGGGISTVRSNATGKMLEFDSVSAGAASCSVQEGNAFAN